MFAQYLLIREGSRKLHNIYSEINIVHVGATSVQHLVTRYDVSDVGVISHTAGCSGSQKEHDT